MITISENEITEAMETLNGFSVDEKDEKMLHARNIAIELMKKQIAKEVIPTPESDYYEYKCPVCNRHYAWCLRTLYCECGQKLDFTQIKRKLAQELLDWTNKKQKDKE